MARIFQEFTVNGRRGLALIDTGSVRSYMRRAFHTPTAVERLEHSLRVALGGKVHELREAGLLRGTIEGLEFFATVFLLDDLGEDERGRKIDLLVGATTLEEWGAALLLPEGRLDLRGLRRREFTEF